MEQDPNFYIIIGIFAVLIVSIVSALGLRGWRDWIALKQKITEHPKNKIAIAKMKDEGLLASRFLPELLEDKQEFFTKLEKVGMQRPIMLFWGYNDPTAPLTDGMELYHLIAQKQLRTSLHIVNQAGHHSFRERAAEFNRVVAEFVEGVGRGE